MKINFKEIFVEPDLDLDSIVDAVMKEDNSFPMDSSVRLINTAFPKEQHEVLGIPGKFVGGVNTSVETMWGDKLKADIASLVLPDEKVKLISIVNSEHQNEFPDDDKLKIIFKYDIGFVYEHGIQCISVIFGNFGSMEDGEIVREIYGVKKSLFVININDEKIQEKLNTITDKVNTNQVVSVEDAINLGHSVIFSSKKVAKDNIKTAVALFKNAKFKDVRLKNVTLRVISNMVRHRFRDDENEVRRLLKMLYEDLKYEELKNDSMFSGLINYLEEFEEFLEVKKGELAERDAEISEMEAELSKLNTELSKSDVEIYLRDQYIKKLESIIQNMNPDILHNLKN